MEKIAKNNCFVFYFNIKGSKDYNQRIVICDKELISWNCDCPFGSAFRFSENNIKNKSTCKHIKEAFEQLKKKGELKC